MLFKRITCVANNAWRPGRLFSVLVLVVGGCTMVATDRWDDMFGPAEPRDRIVSTDTDMGERFSSEVQPILKQRCVVCHGCYDSPCQLNLASPEGIDRGASKDKVYNSARFKVAPLTRMFEDAQTTAEWREKEFWPVLNEHDQTPQANLEASVMHHMLSLKRNNPLPDTPVLDEKEFDLKLDRDQFCAKPDELDEFDRKHPRWGMPYALPALSTEEFSTLESWLEEGARMAHPPAYSRQIAAAVDTWESFLNGNSLKQQLMSRYLYEHWFLANLYFRNMGEDVHFKLVRSATPPGEPIVQTATRRPYDDPGVERVYYRLRFDHSTVLDKTHMPYALDSARMTWLQTLFLDADFAVAELPSFEPQVAANPFIAYQAIPVQNRWEFLRAEAQFTVMNFIKGPVCRGQVAVDVIRDNFWVFFEESEVLNSAEAAAFLSEQEINLSIPVQAGSKAAPIRVWRKYAKLQNRYLEAKNGFINEAYTGGRAVDLDIIWDGDGTNQNAALTVFRHFDSATVVKGLVGPPPKTAWLIDYPIFERIYYLLVAGFDVYGNLGHQVTTRLYMDFLRLESEFNFLTLLPADVRRSEAESWYEGASDKQKSYIYGSRASFDKPTAITYLTDDPKLELFGMLRERLASVINPAYDLDQSNVPPSHRLPLAELAELKGQHLGLVPEMVLLNIVSDGGSDAYYTILRNTAHSNITSLFNERKNLVPEQNSLTVARGFIGSYPEAYWRVNVNELPDLVTQVAAFTGDASYATFMDRYGVRRTAADFWDHSDKVMAAHYAADPVANGLLDYNRLENR